MNCAVSTFLVLVYVMGIVSGNGCLPDWSFYNGNCYKHFNNPNSRVDYATAQIRCQQNKGRLSDVRDKEELQFLGRLVHIPGGSFDMSDLPLIGLYKTQRDNPVNAVDGSIPYVKWCKAAEPNDYQGKEHCVVIVADNEPSWGAVFAGTPDDPCYRDLFCDGSHTAGGYSRYVCKAPLQIVCDKPNTEAVNGTCVCKKDFIDITETDVPEKTKYKPGEKCISKDPCKDVKSLAVNFLVDSSQSIGERNWDSLVSFLKSGADLLPNSTRVGFVKYSNNVTFAKFLSSGWSKSEYQKFVPFRFDKGETNTAAAFEKATAMLKKDKNRNQVAVLITDGLPFSSEIDEKDMLAKTSKAAKKLRKSGVSLVALGYGEELDRKKIRVIHSWLEDPEEDYFEFDKTACDLKPVHMCLLMRKICRRAVNY